MATLQEKLRTAGGAVVCALVPAVALAYWPALAAPFSALKTALLFWAAGVGAAALFLSGVSLRLSRPQGWVTAAWLYLLAQVVCGIASPHEYLGAAALVPLVATAALAAVVSWSGKGRERSLLFVIGGTAAMVALVVIVQVVWGVDLFRPFGYRIADAGLMRRSGTLGNPDFVGTFLAVAAPALLFGWAAGKDSGTRGASALGLAACAAAVALSGFRGGLVALAVGLVVTSFVLLRGRRRWLVIAAVAIAAAGLVVPASWHKRGAGEAAAGRAFIWRASVPQTACEWILGAGPNTFAYTYPSRIAKVIERDPATARFAGAEQHAENDFVEALYETGVLGLAALVAFFVLWFRGAWRTASEKETQHAASLPAAMGGTAALATAALFDFPLHRPETLALLALWVALPFPAEVVADGRSRSWAVRGTVAAVILLVAGWAGTARINGSYHLRGGQSLEAYGAYRSAADEYRQALRWDGVNPQAHFSLARALAESGDNAAALEAAGIGSRYVDEPAYWVLRYRIQRDMGRDGLPELRAAALRFPYSQALARELEAAEAPRR